MKQTVKPELKNPEMKAAYIAAHWGQRVIRWHQWAKDTPNSRFSNDIPMTNGGIGKGWFLELTPLDQISDVDAIEVAKILDFHDGDGLIVRRNKDHIGIYDKYNDEPFHSNTLYLFHNGLEVFSKDERRKVFQYDLERLLIVTDFLRSRSYALPWNGHSVEELIEAGYCQLRKGGGDES